MQDSTIDALQSNHVEQGKLENILGIYQMANYKKITSDNTEIFHASPMQNFSDTQAFSLATQLAITPHQESVAVSIPSSQATIADIAVTFTTLKPTIKEVVDKIRYKLPASAGAFSLHMCSTCLRFNHARITEIEWLGKKSIYTTSEKHFLRKEFHSSKDNLI